MKQIEVIHKESEDEGKIELTKQSDGAIRNFTMYHPF